MTATIPGREWVWSDDHTRYGVHTFEGKLVWWGQPRGVMGRHGGGASQQAYTDFLTHGPEQDCPPEVIAELLLLFGYSDPPWEVEN